LDKEISENLQYSVNSALAKLAKYYSKIENDSYLIATVLDPRFKLAVYKKTQDPDALMEAARIAVEKSFNEYKEKYLPNRNLPQEGKRKRDWYDEDEEEDEMSELQIYLSEKRNDCNLLEYWNSNKTRFPILARMARDCLAIQSTGKDIEGTFSKGRRTIPYYRKRQTGRTIRNQMLVNAGYDFGSFK
jgi:hypothetical protein